LNDLGSPDSRKMLEDNVITPIRELHNDAMFRLRNSLEAVAADFDSSSDRLSEARTQQQEVLDGMQKILAQMSFWESFVDVINQVRQVIKLETEVHESTQGERKQRTEGLFDDE